MQVTPFLMFQGDAEAAIHFYRGIFPDFEIVELTRWDAGGGGKEGTIQRARFTLAGQLLRCFDSAPIHDFGFTPPSRYSSIATTRHRSRRYGRRCRRAARR